ncbi:MAG: polysaccharide pyruvyl transferase family protein [Actinomycetota bacterium]
MDAMVVAGGSPFRSLMTRPQPRRVDAVRNLGTLSVAARALGKPVAAVGVGADSLPGRASRALARGLVRQADLFVLRDEESAHTLATAGANAPFRVGSDPTWAILDQPVAPAPQAPQCVTVVLRHPSEAPFDADFLTEALHSVERGGLRVQLQPWLVTNDGPDDLSLARHLAACLDHAIILETPSSLIEARDSLAGSCVVVGMRLHALLAAASAGVRFVAASVTPGPRGLAHRFGQPSIAHGATPERFAEAVFAAASGPRPNPATVRGEVASAEEGFRLLRLLLNGGASDDVDEITGLPLRPAEWAQ